MSCYTLWVIFNKYICVTISSITSPIQKVTRSATHIHVRTPNKHG